jgi:hypothetical protein
MPTVALSFWACGLHRPAQRNWQVKFAHFWLMAFPPLGPTDSEKLFTYFGVVGSQMAQTCSFSLTEAATFVPSITG